MTDLELAIKRHEIKTRQRFIQAEHARKLGVHRGSVHQVIKRKARSRRIESYLDQILNNKN